MKRKFISSLLCLCMLVSLLPVAAFAVEPRDTTTTTTTDPQIKVGISQTADAAKVAIKDAADATNDPDVTVADGSANIVWIVLTGLSTTAETEYTLSMTNSENAEILGDCPIDYNSPGKTFKTNSAKYFIYFSLDEAAENGTNAQINLTNLKAGDCTISVTPKGGNPLTANVTLTETGGVWTLTEKSVDTYTVTFDANGGAFAGGTAPSLKVAEITDENLATITKPTREGYVFSGWATTKSATKAETVTGEVTADITLYAVWVKAAEAGSISVGFSWNGDDANAAINAAITAANKEKTITDSIDQTYWLLVNDPVTDNTKHYWYEVTRGTTVLDSGAIDGAEGKIGLVYDSFLMKDGKDTIIVKAGDKLTFSLYDAGNATAASRPEGKTAVTKEVTIPTNPLAISDVTLGEDVKTVTVKFNNDLYGRYVVELAQGTTVLKSVGTECDRETDAGKIAKDTGIDIVADTTLTAGSYTVNLYAKDSTTDVKAGEAIAVKEFTLSDTVDSVTVFVKDGDTYTESSAIKATVDATATPKTITLSGNVANPATMTLKLEVKDADGNVVGTVDNIDVTYNDGEFTVAEGANLTTNLGTVYNIVIGELNPVDTPVAPPVTNVVIPDNAKIDEGVTEEELGKVAEAAGTVAPSDNENKAILTDLATEAAIAVDSAKENENDAYGDTAALDSLKEVVPSASDVKVVVQPYLDVQLTGYSKTDDGATKVLSVDITAKYRVVATSEAVAPEDIVLKSEDESDINAVDITKAADKTAGKDVLPVSESITLEITLPTGFTDASTLFVKHTNTRTNETHYHKGAVSGTKLTFTSDDGLSPFEIDSSKTAMGANIGGIVSEGTVTGGQFFDDLQSAVNAAKDGDQIILLDNVAAGTSISVTGDARTFTILLNGKTLTKDQITGTNVTADANEDGTIITVTKTSGGGSGNGSGGGGGGGSTTKPTDPTTPTDPTNPTNPTTPTFTDVPAGAYYEDAVKWAVDKGITNGLTATTFGPNNSCTRGQMVTFLWRAAGSPAASATNSFTDVASGEYYYDAVLWAVEKGITNGTSATTFSPNATVNRGQTVTFLYRYAESPAATGDTSFTDVAADAFYADAVKWAVAEGITNGTSATTFAPASNCTRGQIVTFLYRQMAE